MGSFKGLCSRSPKEVLQAARLGPWFDAWDKLTKARNDIAHGAPGGRSDLRDTFETVRKDAVPAMMELRNSGLAALKATSTMVVS